ncbi:MAG: hypothetical protein U1E33_02460 [Rhodospirillales bacterium]
MPAHVSRVGLLVDADDDAIAAVLAHVPLDLLQLHGSETPARVADVGSRFRLPVIKAVFVEEPRGRSCRRRALCRVADRLLFDARPPQGASRPGGNARAFDWRVLAGHARPLPWLLAGGLHAGNLAEAVQQSGAPAVDVSSGVEDAPDSP